MAATPSPFARRVLDAVDAIPSGHVLSYGDVAEYIGAGSARGVGAVMARFGAEVPWHRVVMTDGRPAPGHELRQLALLRAEGVPLRVPGDRVQMARARWDGGVVALRSS